MTAGLDLQAVCRWICFSLESSHTVKPQQREMPLALTLLSHSHLQVPKCHSTMHQLKYIIYIQKMSFRRQTSWICPLQAEFHKSPVWRWLPGVPTLRRTRWSYWWSPLTPGSHPPWSQVEGQAWWYRHGLAWPEVHYLEVEGTPSKHHNLQEKWSQCMNTLS